LKRVIFTSRSNAEITAILEAYTAVCQKTGIAFANSVTIAVRHIEKFPKAWAIYHQDFRKFILNPFPYALAFRELNDRIEVYAVVDLRREPGYWLQQV